MTIYIQVVQNKLCQKWKMKDIQRLLIWKMFLILKLEKARSLFQNVITRTIAWQRHLTTVAVQLPILTMNFATRQAKEKIVSVNRLLFLKYALGFISCFLNWNYSSTLDTVWLWLWCDDIQDDNEVIIKFSGIL